MTHIYTDKQSITDALSTNDPAFANKVIESLTADMIHLAKQRDTVAELATGFAKQGIWQAVCMAQQTMFEAQVKISELSLVFAAVGITAAILEDRLERGVEA